MNANERNARQQRVKRLREAAVRLACAKPIGIVEIAGVQMGVYEFVLRGLMIEYLTPQHASSQASRLIIRVAGANVLDCEFDDRQIARFKYVAGDWERSLLA